MANLELQLTDKLKTLLKQTALSVTEQQQQQLVKLVLLLNKWNKAYNLTSVRDPQEMVVKHILDSLVVSPYLQGDRFIDVGTGPGLPGLPLAISFIRNAVRELELTNVEAVLSRAEEYQPDHQFDGVLSRAFASLKEMTDWCHHLPKKEGHFYALKGLYHDEEVQALEGKFMVKEVVKLHVPELVGERHLIILH